MALLFLELFTFGSGTSFGTELSERNEPFHVPVLQFEVFERNEPFYVPEIRDFSERVWNTFNAFERSDHFYYLVHYLLI